ncbi:MAG TPA: GreA/GreB family elongation factor [Candidatus Kapabacteria bacterium]|nr:GreA/GreB family elongation factor [Candidatus Kapabacteria bacterium]
MRIPTRKPTKFSHLDTDPLLTREKFDELNNELNRLKTVTRPKAMAEVSRLAAMGDFSENAAYQIAKGKLRGINNRIMILETHLNKAEIITPDHNTATIHIGHTVTVRDGDIEKTYTILGSSETDPSRGIISHTSPLGAALIGHKIGDRITVPIGKKEKQLVIQNIRIQ